MTPTVTAPGTPVALGLPTPRTPRRRPCRQVMVGSGDKAVPVGGGAPISVQSMTTTLTADIDATPRQIAELVAAGCDIDALPAIVRESPLPVIADIHFQPRYVFQAIDAGCAAVRVNPGNIKKFDDKVREIAAAANVPIRIGVNAGSLDRRTLTKYGKAIPEALVESALWECSLFEEHGFQDLEIPVKHHAPTTMVAAYRLLAAPCDYPLHLGVTEAGPVAQGSVKSAVAFGILLSEGIGDTIRVSLTGPPVEEFDGFPHPLRVAVMGCVVNGPGEAREADHGVSCGNGKGQIFVRGEVIATVPEHDIVTTLLEHALSLAGEQQPDGQQGDAP